MIIYQIYRIYSIYTYDIHLIYIDTHYYKISCRFMQYIFDVYCSHPSMFDAEVSYAAP